MSLKLGRCDCSHCGYFFFNEYEIPFCPHCEKQISFYRSPYGKDPDVFAAEEAKRKEIEDIKYANIKSILSVMPHKNPLSDTEFLTLVTIFFATNPPDADSAFITNEYSRLDAIIFTSSIIRASCISNATSQQQAQSISNEYISLLTKTCKALFSINEPDYTAFLVNRWSMYDNIFMHHEGDINMLCDIFTNALILDKDNCYAKLDDKVTYINNLFDIYSVKTGIKSYIDFYCEPFIYYVKKALSEHVIDTPDIYASSKTTSYQKKQYKKTPSVATIFFVVAFSLLIIGISIALGNYYDTNNTYDYPNEDYATTSLYTLTPPPHNDVARYASYEPNFDIKTSGHSNYYYFLKVVDCISNETVQSVFIHSGKTASIYVPNGTYKVRWVSGENWYGYNELFNNSSAQEADDTFTFSETQGWEITLYTVTNGNLSTDTIDISDF